MRCALPFAFLLATTALGAACSVERSGLNSATTPGEDLGALIDLGAELDDGEVGTDIGTVGIDAGPRDLGVTEVDAGPPPPVCDPAACPGRFCAGALCGYARSCNELKNAPGGPTADGVYTIDGDGPDFLPPADAFCDMTNDVGGWTLVLKADGSRPTFEYGAVLWTDETELGGTPLYDRVEAKLRTFRTVSFTQMRIVMVTGDQTRALVMDVGAISCVELLNRGFTSTAVPRGTWLAMVPDVSLQDRCGQQGVNVAPRADQTRTRIGIVGNNENNCDSTNSRIGIGGAGENDGVTTGNVARWNGIGEDRNTVSFGYVFVR